MAPKHLGFSFAIIASCLLALLAALTAFAQPPANLPLLPPPDSAPEKKISVTQIPIQLRIAVTDLEKELLRAFIQKIDPKAEPKLPFVIKGSEREFALGADQAKPEDVPPALPKPVEKPPEMRAERPMLIPRQPGTHPRLDRLAQRPLVAAIVGAVLGTLDLNYRIELRSLKLTVTGKTLALEIGAGFSCEGKANQPPAVPGAVQPNVRDISIKMKVTKNLEWNESGKLELKEGTTSVWVDPEAPLVGFPRLDVERVLKLNGVLALLNGTLDRELMKVITGENLPDLAVIAPNMKLKMPFLAIAELTAYPIRGDEEHVYFALDVGLIAANRKSSDTIKIVAKAGPAPEPKLHGRILFDKDGKPEVKLGPAP